MKRLLILLFSVLSLSAFAQQKKVAVMNPLCRDNSVSSIYFSIVRGSFESVASATDGYEAYNRSDLDAITSEIHFQHSGAVDVEQIKKIGEIVGVDFVLVIVLSADEEYLMVESKILNVESSQYDRSASKLMSLSPPIVEKTCSELAQDLFKINLLSGIQNGKIIYKGCRYEGEYKDMKPHGKGKLYGNEESPFVIYEGGFSDGERHGYGIVVSKDNSRYDGNWVNGSIDGDGKLYLANGFRYEGTFHKNDLAYGTMYLPNGDRYVGSLENFLPNGRGVCYFTNGNKYVGEWDNGIKEGTGTYWWVDGKRYEGHFSRDKQNGEGTLILNNGDIWAGTWIMGVMQGVFEVFSKGLRYTVKVVDGEPTEVIE